MDKLKIFENKIEEMEKNLILLKKELRTQTQQINQSISLIWEALNNLS